MPNYSLIFARTLDHAHQSAVADWGWQAVDELRNEFRRPDTNERVRWIPDTASALNDLRWLTRVYLGSDWHLRKDAVKVVDLIEAGFFKRIDAELPAPRGRAKDGPSFTDKTRQLADFIRATEIRSR